MIQECENCLKQFETDRYNKRFCSKKCNNASYRKRISADGYISAVTKICEHCGVQFETKKNARFCSEFCQRGNYRDNNKEKITLYQIEYRENNKDELNAANRLYQKENAKELGEKRKERRHKKAEQKPPIIKKCLQCGEKFIDNTKSHNKIYCSHACACRHWMVSNPEKSRNRVRKRRAIKLAINQKFTIEDEKFIYDLFHDRCFNCGNIENLCVDHVYPLSKGNALTKQNACILCKTCNSSKGDKYPLDFYNIEKFVELLTILRLF